MDESFLSTLAWHHWAIAGLVMVASELVIPTLVLIWFGAGALVVALALAILPDMGLIPQLLIWGVVSVALVAVWFKILRPYRAKTLVGRASAHVVGEVGLLVGDVDSFQKSRVRFQTPIVGSDVWDCVANEPIKAGERVKVVSIEGTILKITKA